VEPTLVDYFRNPADLANGRIFIKHVACGGSTTPPPPMHHGLLFLVLTPIRSREFVGQTRTPSPWTQGATPTPGGNTPTASLVIFLSLSFN
jgi:hypothetical protein